MVSYANSSTVRVLAWLSRFKAARHATRMFKRVEDYGSSTVGRSHSRRRREGRLAARLSIITSTGIRVDESRAQQWLQDGRSLDKWSSRNELPWNVPRTVLKYGTVLYCTVVLYSTPVEEDSTGVRVLLRFTLVRSNLHS